MAVPNSPTPYKVGILGGGQLARMLAQAAKPLGIDLRVLTEAADDPAARLCPAILGTLEDPRVLRAFYSQAETVIFENEFVDTKRLARLAAEFAQLTFQPSLAVLERLQDKKNQKELLGRLAIPTARWIEMTPTVSPAELAKTFPAGAVLKWSRMGYDGKGLYFYDPARPDPAAIGAFGLAGSKLGGKIYAEERIPFKRELAIVACRSITGEFAAYPLVQSKQEHGICSLVTGPAVRLGNSAQQETLATGYARRLMESLDYVGTLALELFEKEDGGLLVNEIAPRVHNSGHYSQDACPASQFENHLRATLGLPLGDTRPKAMFAMLNLLGPEGVKLASSEAPLPVAPAGAHLHWYEKKKIRGRRKMGHFNATATGPDELDKMIRSLQSAQEAWRKKLAEKESRRE